MWSPLVLGLKQLLVQPQCPLCGALRDQPSWRHDLCPECDSKLQLPEQAIKGATPLPWLASGLYSGQLRTAMLQLRRSCNQALLSALSSSLRKAIPAGAILIPIPSWKPKHRANPLPLMLAKALERPSTALLERSRAVVGQHHLKREQRLQNQQQSFRLHPATNARQAIDWTRQEAWLVDDIITTGATVWAAALALQREGIPVGGAACLGHTPRKPPQ